MDMNISIGQVVGIYTKKKDCDPWELIREGYFKEKFGLIRDIHSKAGDRQVSILTERARNQLSTLENPGLCTGRFHENIRVKDLNIANLSIGKEIIIGETIQEITEIGKTCFPECNIIETGQHCPLLGEVIFTKVKKGGSVKIGDCIKTFNS